MYFLCIILREVFCRSPKTLTGLVPIDLSMSTRYASPAYTREPPKAVRDELDKRLPEFCCIFQDSRASERDQIDTCISDIVIEETVEERRTWIWWKKVREVRRKAWLDGRCGCKLLVFSYIFLLNRGGFRQETQAWLRGQVVDIERAMEDRYPGLEEREFEWMLWGHENKAWMALVLTFLRPKLIVRQQQPHHG